MGRSTEEVYETHIYTINNIFAATVISSELSGGRNDGRNGILDGRYQVLCMAAALVCDSTRYIPYIRYWILAQENRRLWKPQPSSTRDIIVLDVSGQYEKDD
jgi:hypothetical protein